MLGEYGITVTYNKKPAKLRKSTVKPLFKITTMGVILGSTFTNTGNASVLVYKGKKITGISTLVSEGETLRMTKGYSTITVVNTSTLVAAKFTVMVAK
jgi:hypothetical protein